MEERKTFEQIEAELAALMDAPWDGLTAEELASRGEYAARLSDMEKSKVDNFARFIKAQAASAGHMRAEAERLSKRARNIEANIKWLKGVYLRVMQARGATRVEGNAYSLARRSHKYVLITDPARLDPDFIRSETISSPDKAAIRDAIENGVIVEGAALGESESLSIK